MSSSAEFDLVIDGIIELFDSLNELQLSKRELEKLQTASHDEQGNELDEWETEISLIENAPMRISRTQDQQICIEPVDVNNQDAVDSVNKVRQAYSRIKVINQLKQKGYDKVKEEKLPDGSIRLVVQKWQ